MHSTRPWIISGSVFVATLSFAIVEWLFFQSEIPYKPPGKKAQITGSADKGKSAAVKQLLEIRHSRAPNRIEITSQPSAKAIKGIKQLQTKRKPASFQPASRAPYSLNEGEKVATETGRGPSHAETAAASGRPKAIWIWLNSGAARHKLQHGLTNGTHSKFSSLQAPSLGFRAGFEVENFGLDASYDSSPGKVTSAPNASVEGGNYHWNALRADATWRGLGEDLKLRMGGQQHTSPFLYPDNSTARIHIRRTRVNFAAVGLEWSPPLSEASRLEAKATYLHALSADTLDRAEIDLNRRLSGYISLAWIFSAGEHLRLGSYLQSERQDFGFTYRASPGAMAVSGTQKITSHSLGLRIGWEY